MTDREFLTRLADRGVEVHVLAEAGEPVIEHPNLFPHAWRRRIRKRLPYVGNLDVALDLRSLLRELGAVDWIRFNSPAAVGIGSLLGAGRHRLWASYLHCEDFWFRRFVDSWLPGRCDLVTCLSEDTRRDVIARCPASDHDRNIVVSLGIDGSRVATAGRSRQAVRAELGVKPDETLVLFVGVLTARKGITDLVAAWRGLGAQPGIRLLLVSKPVEERETRLVETLVREDPRVQHLPRVAYEQIPEYFRAADLFFFPTHLEGFGIVVGEAMAAGLPVVTTRAQGVRTVVVEGETALCTDVGDVGAMTEAVGSLVRDPHLRQRLGTAGRRRILEHFSWAEKIDTLMAALASPEATPGRSGLPMARESSLRSPAAGR